MTKPEGEARMDCRDAVGLLPCPFCGPDGHVEQAGSLSRGDRRVVCETCGAHGPVHWASGKAVSAWNTRALSAPVPTGEGGAGWQPMADQPHAMTLLFKAAPDEDGVERVWLGLAHADDADAVAWACLPDAHPKPAQGEGVEALAEAWSDRVEVLDLVLSLTRVFESHANPALMSRFRQQVMAVIQQGFIEGVHAAALTTGKGGEG